MSQTKDSFLNVPTHEKIWLISPPGSPPIDWRQTREDPPNAIHLESRLQAALQELSTGQFVLDPSAVVDYDSAEENDGGGDDDSEPLSFSLGEPAISAAQAASTSTVDESDNKTASGKGKQLLTLPTILIQGVGDANDLRISSRKSTERAYQPTPRPPT
ncbi:hypothetical protein GGI12_005433 [Dipsacomyces acuminosporus]|nr:hypothetical protein GGI12_005433 [Dipsacomyces acuminosporus]